MLSSVVARCVHAYVAQIVGLATRCGPIVETIACARLVLTTVVGVAIDTRNFVRLYW